MPSTRGIDSDFSWISYTSWVSSVWSSCGNFVFLPGSLIPWTWIWVTCGRLPFISHDYQRAFRSETWLPNTHSLHKWGIPTNNFLMRIVTSRNLFNPNHFSLWVLQRVRLETKCKKKNSAKNFDQFRISVTQLLSFSVLTFLGHVTFASNLPKSMLGSPRWPKKNTSAWDHVETRPQRHRPGEWLQQCIYIIDDNKYVTRHNPQHIYISNWRYLFLKTSTRSSASIFLSIVRNITTLPLEKPKMEPQNSKGTKGISSSLGSFSGSIFFCSEMSFALFSYRFFNSGPEGSIERPFKWLLCWPSSIFCTVTL